MERRLPLARLEAQSVVAKPAPGVVEEELEIRSAAAQLGSKGGKARAAKLSNEQRKAIARKAAEKRWKKNGDTAR